MATCAREGVGGLVLRSVAKDNAASVVLELSGNAVRQDGLSASLTAPNGVAQSRLVAAAIASASMSPSDLRLIESHGTGTPLGDPTEIRSLVRASSDISAPIYGIKANLGHLEPAAGSAGLIVLTTSLKGRLAGACAQLRTMNPKIAEATLAGARIDFPTQPTAAALRDIAKASASVSSFGFSGTIAHTVMRSHAQPLQKSAKKLLSFLTDEKVFALRRKSFDWRTPTSSLLGLLNEFPDSDGDLSFVAPVSGPLVAIVAHHIVQRRVVFPGAGYLEVARAATVHEVTSGEQTGYLSQTYFLSPLFAEPSSELSMEVSVYEGGQIEIRSGKWDGSALLESTLHCMVNESSPTKRPGNAAGSVLTSRMMQGGAIDTSALFTALHKSGLQYGPEYRRMQQLWAATGYKAGLTKLLRRTDLQSTQTHPADVDAVLQLQQTSALARSTSSIGGRETALPFAVEKATLAGGSGRQWGSCDGGEWHAQLTPCGR